ncbi:MAG: helix-turn-helix domain-containing protein [Proteobacteria bacterium]|nr:helix-turn-helix domain-containing protein [Pseudomonadota bacterium]
MVEISDKWGVRVAERGFAQIPNYLLQLNQFLGEEHLSPVELLVLLHLVGAWWKKDELPFPSVATLAVRSGVSNRQVQRALNRLEELKLLARVKRRTRGIITSNAYDLAPLVSFLNDLAKVFPNAYPRRIQADGPIGPGEKPQASKAKAFKVRKRPGT